MRFDCDNWQQVAVSESFWDEDFVSELFTELSHCFEQNELQN